MGEFLTPVLALVIWTFVMWVVMYKRRIPAMNKVSKNPQDFIDNPGLYEQIPLRVRAAADNYNHLHEQPVIFYALMFYIAGAGQADNIYLYLAWAYVAIRIVHSLIQITSNAVMARFSVFTLGTLALMIMGARAAIALF